MQACNTVYGSRRPFPPGHCHLLCWHQVVVQIEDNETTALMGGGGGRRQEPQKTNGHCQMIAVLITLPQYNMIVAATFVDSKFQRHIFNVEGSANVFQLKSLLESKGLVPHGFSSKLSYQKKLLSDQDSLHSIGYISENYVSFVCIRSTVHLTPAAPSHVSSITADIKESPSVPALVAPHTSEKDEGSASDATTAAPPVRRGRG